jgi:aryl-alcohol dehydrogenase-like predicted oxidoreductase
MVHSPVSGVEYVDLWFIQGRDSETPLEETLSAMDQAVLMGKVRYVGFSNINGWQLAQAATMQNPLFGKNSITSLQSEYSLLNRSIEDEIIPATEELGVGLLAWSPLGRGVLTGKYRNGTPSDSRGASPHFAEFISPFSMTAVVPLLKRSALQLKGSVTRRLKLPSLGYETAV